MGICLMGNATKKTAQEVCDYMNELLTLDRACFGALIDIRIPCNKNIADSDKVIVVDKNGQYHLGLLGFVNGYLGENRITVEYDDKGNINRFFV